MSLPRQLLLTLGLLVLAGGGFYGWSLFAPNAGDARGGREPTPVPVVLGIVERQALERRVEAVGTTRARQAVEIVPLASGRIKELGFVAGQAVGTGAVLAQLDDDIERADVAEAEALLREKELALDRARTLQATRAVAQASLDLLIAERATAQARLDRALRRLEDRSVRAPFAGHVGLRRVDVGTRVDDETVLTTLDDLAEIELAFDVPERHYGLLVPGQPVMATAAAFAERRFDGVVDSVDTRIDPTARSFAVRAVFANPDRELPAGMFMHVVVVLEERSVLVVPEGSVLVEGETSYVFTVEEGRAQRRIVSLGQRGVGTVEVLSGLVDGEEVVVRGVQRIREGIMVEPVDHAPVAGERIAGSALATRS